MNIFVSCAAVRIVCIETKVLEHYEACGGFKVQVQGSDSDSKFKISFQLNFSVSGLLISSSLYDV